MKSSGVIWMVGAVLITVALGLLSFFGAVLARGGVLVEPGPLNASVGDPLGGVESHADLGNKCSACHSLAVGNRNMSDKCLNCHTSYYDDLYQAGQIHAILRSARLDIECTQCHTEHHGADASLTDLNIDKFDHSITGFSLSAHQSSPIGAELQCTTCHPENLGTPDTQVCIDCHSTNTPDVFATHLASFGEDCLDCHSGTTTLAATDHDEMGFPMIGGHSKASCEDCHAGGSSAAAFGSVSTNCFDCHAEQDAHNGALGQMCMLCHAPDGWDQLVFDHDNVAFTLVGSHQWVDCEGCHTGGNFSGISQDCASCHIDLYPHPGQFGTSCESCHTPDGWENATFDHVLIDTTDCQGCHANERPANHYQAQCSACHSTNGWLPVTFNHSIAGASDCQACHTSPAGHYEVQCSACHQTTGWRPVTFNHSAVGATDCQSCHARPANHYQGQCSSCHSPVSWAFNHGASANCQACHTPPGDHGNRGQCSQCHTTAGWDRGEGEEEGNGDDD
jgi:hypothetical protein